MKIISMGEPIEEVRYDVEIKGGPNPDWRVRRVRLVEALSEAYELELELVSAREHVAVDPHELLGADVALDLERSGCGRTIHGLIDRVLSAGIVSNLFVVTLRAVPAWVYLAQHVDTRIFQDCTATEILEDVLEPALAQYGRKVDASRLHEQYVMRDYCVQYAESDFDFASRIMEEEGICYYFRPEEVDGKPTGVELMILADQQPSGPNADFDTIEGIFDREVHIIGDNPANADVESIQSLEWSRSEQVNKLVMRRFNWKRPGRDQVPEAEQSTAASRDRVREVYIPEDRRRVEDRLGDEGYEGTEVDEDEKRLLRRRFELLEASRDRGSGTSNLVGMCVGGLLTLADHVDDAIAGTQLLVTRVALMGASADAQPSADAGSVPYHNSFSCQRADTPFRPEIKTRRPRIFGPQTAIVTGPPGEEIHTDKHGRIKIRFHWDRLSPHDDTSSCWVRVTQSWGTWFLPRIGTEVLVEFLDGNPDRPLVTGCVYNSNNGPPYPLPDDKTKTTIKSNTTPGGGGSNELRFEDGKGSEEVYLHAQHDFNEVVENDHCRTVEMNETIDVGVDRCVSVGGDQTTTIEGNHVVVVNGGGDGSPHYSITVNDDYALSAAKTVHVKAEERITLQCQTTTIELTPDRIVLQAGKDGSRIVLDVEALVRSKEQGQVFLDDAGNVYAEAKDKASLSLTSGAVLQSEELAKVELTGVAKIAAPEEGAALLLDANATMTGDVVTLDSQGAKLELTTAAALSGTEMATIAADTVMCSAESLVTIEGATIDVLGGAMTTVKGAAVKIN